MNRMVGLVESALKVSALLAAFGYMSLRAHLNYLGISSASPLPSERYLMEAHQWLTLTLIPLISITIVCVLILAAGIFLHSLVVRRRSRSFLAEDFMERVFRHERTAWIVMFVLLAFLFAWQYRFSSGDDRSGLVIGCLEAGRIPDAAQRAEGYLEYLVLSLICGWGVLYASFGWTPGKEHSVREDFLRGLQFLALILLAFYVPVTFARAAHTFEYPMAEVHRSDGPNISGILLLETSDDVRLWRTDQGVGQAVAIRREKIVSITFGPVRDILQEARKSAKSSSNPIP